jgi:flagellar protein FlgJ
MTQASMIGMGSGLASLTAAQATDPAATAARAKDQADLKKTAHAFEAIFVRQLLSKMRAASGGESIDGSSAVSQFQEMSDAQSAESLADRGGLGIANMLLQQLDKKQ